MGYSMSLVDCAFTIRARNKASALQAVRALAYDEPSMSGCAVRHDNTVTRHYSWVTTDDFHLAKTLEVALQAWRWEPYIDKKTGDIVNLMFCGEKAGDDERLFAQLAPFVERGSYIQMSGEDGAVWRWVFKDGFCREVSPQWPDL